MGVPPASQTPFSAISAGFRVCTEGAVVLFGGLTVGVARDERHPEADGAGELECRAGRRPFGLAESELFHRSQMEIRLFGHHLQGHATLDEGVPDEAAQVGDPILVGIVRPEGRGSFLVSSHYAQVRTPHCISPMKGI